MTKSPVTLKGGLATMGPEAIKIRNLLDARILKWAEEIGAESMLYPPLVSVADLEKIDYFKNFPHLAVCTTRIHPDHLKDKYDNGHPDPEIPSDHLTCCGYTLPSAACYNVFFSNRDSEFDGVRYFTTIATCFRNEKEYVGLQRLWSFTMREIVCLGTADEAKAHLSSFKEKVLAFGNDLGLNLKTDTATDPFFEQNDSRAMMQRMFPTKEEFLYNDSLAIASVNFHRNFFGDRMGIKRNGEALYSGCVAFGMERWLHALFEVFDGDTDAIAARLSE